MAATEIRSLRVVRRNVRQIWRIRCGVRRSGDERRSSRRRGAARPARLTGPARPGLVVVGLTAVPGRRGRVRADGGGYWLRPSDALRRRRLCKIDDITDRNLASDDGEHYCVFLSVTERTSLIQLLLLLLLS